MLEKDPSKRITASEALNHPFIKAGSHQDKTALPTEPTINNIVGLQSFNW